MITEILGSEHDLILTNAVLDVLREMGAEAGSRDWALAGSQEINTVQFTVCGSPVTIEAETFVGLSVTGERAIVEAIVKRVHERWTD